MKKKVKKYGWAAEGMKVYITTQFPDDVPKRGTIEEINGANIYVKLPRRTYRLHLYLGEILPVDPLVKLRYDKKMKALHRAWKCFLKNKKG